MGMGRGRLLGLRRMAERGVVGGVCEIEVYCR